MPTYNFGSGGSQRTTHTSGPGDGWYTTGIPLPDPRAIYDGSRPIRIASVAATAGSGNRTYRYALGSSGWLSSGYHLVATNSIFSFRVQQVSGTIYLALLLGQGGKNTYWNDGSLAPSGADSIQPGTMTWYQAPSAPGVSSITPSPTVAGSVTVVISAPSDNGGLTVTNYTHQFATSPSFGAGTIVLEQESPASSTTFSGLPTGVTLYHRVMAQNGVTDGLSKKGGAASTTKNFSLGTAPTTAPGITVVPDPLGTSAQVGLTPPSGLGGLPLSGYDVEYEYLSPPPIPTPGLFLRSVLASGATTDTVTGLVPGASYRWRAFAKNTAGQSPPSAWTTYVQPQPNTTPGLFFDGNTADTPDIDYAWAGVVNNSTSAGVGRVPTGWQVTGYDGTGAAVVSQDTQTGMSAIVTVMADMSAPFRVGLFGNSWYAAVLQGLEYSAAVDVRLPRAQPVRIVAIWRDAAFVEVGSRSYGTTVVPLAGAVRTLSASLVAPTDAEWVQIVVEDDDSHSDWTPWLAGEQFWLDRMIVSLGDIPIAYFDGDTPDGGGFTYTWLATAHRSPSRRAGREEFVNPLLDPECAVPPVPPRPPVIPSDCIEDIVEWDRYWYSIPDYEIPEWLVVLPTIEIRSLVTEERQIRVRVYADPFDRGLSTLGLEDYCAEIIVSYLPADAVLTLDSVSRRAWASVSGGAPISAAHLLYGSDGTPASYPELSCGMRHYVTVDVPPGGVSGNIGIKVALTGRY